MKKNFSLNELNAMVDSHNSTIAVNGYIVGRGNEKAIVTYSNGLERYELTQAVNSWADSHCMEDIFLHGMPTALVHVAKFNGTEFTFAITEKDSVLPMDRILARMKAGKKSVLDTDKFGMGLIRLQAVSMAENDAEKAEIEKAFDGKAYTSKEMRATLAHYGVKVTSANMRTIAHLFAGNVKIDGNMASVTVDSNRVMKAILNGVNVETVNYGKAEKEKKAKTEKEA